MDDPIPPLRVLVCGGRDFTDAAAIADAMDSLPASIVVCHGGAPGADSLAGQWAANHGIACTVFRADWKKHGKAAGPIRNRQMLNEFQPDIVVAFPGGSGTADMVSQAKRVGVEVMQISLHNTSTKAEEE